MLFLAGTVSRCAPEVWQPFPVKWPAEQGSLGEIGFLVWHPFATWRVLAAGCRSKNRPCGSLWRRNCGNLQLAFPSLMKVCHQMPTWFSCGLDLLRKVKRPRLPSFLPKAGPPSRGAANEWRLHRQSVKPGGGRGHPMMMDQSGASRTKANLEGHDGMKCMTLARTERPTRLLGAPKWAQQLNHRKPNDLWPHIKSVANLRLNFSSSRPKSKKQVIKNKEH